jgi:TonB family protein
MVSRGAEKSPHWFTPDGKVNWDTIPKDFDFQTAAPANAAHAAPGLFTADLGTARAALSAGADVNQIDPNLDRTPLTWAAENGSTDIATELLQHGADVNLKDRHGWTPLIAATCGTHPGDPRLGLVQLLLSKGADVNARTEKYTPLSCAIENNRGQSVIDLLIPKAGAKGAPNAADSGTPSRIRVGENVQLAKMIRRVPPVYPPLAKQAMVQGVVALNVILNRDGTVQSATVAAGHPLLAPAAIDAVKQWVYQPTTVNGQPVEVVTTATVVFSLAQGPK